MTVKTLPPSSFQRTQLRSKSNHSRALKFDFDRPGGVHTLSELVGGELSNIVDGELRYIVGSGASKES